jgi:hypothetical protein
MSESTTKKTSGAFDVRNIIGALLTVYGVVLVLMGIFASSEPASPEAPSGGGDVNANLWAGLALLVVGLGFIAWWRLRPIVVPDDVDQDKDVERP